VRIFFGASTCGSLKTKKKSKCPAAYGNVCLQECKNTEFLCELNEVSNKVAASGAVCLRECLLRELSLYKLGS